MRVEAYYNLTRSCWSVRSLEGENKGRVFLYAESLAIENAKFVVRKGGRDKVRREKQKNVHAFVRGSLSDKTNSKHRLPLPVTYNPYKNETFVNRNTGESVMQASLVHLHSDRKVTYLP